MIIFCFFLQLREMLPVTSVDVERSFSQYKHLLNDRRRHLERTARDLMMLYCNGDVEGEFKV